VERSVGRSTGPARGGAPSAERTRTLGAMLTTKTEGTAEKPGATCTRGCAGVPWFDRSDGLEQHALSTGVLQQPWSETVSGAQRERPSTAYVGTTIALKSATMSATAETAVLRDFTIPV